MTDKQLAELFAEGSAPERDRAFAQRVVVDIGRVRRRAHWLALAYRMTAVLVFGGTLFGVGRLVDAALMQLGAWVPQLTEIAVPQFMGVPVPLAVFGLVVGLILRGQRWQLPLQRILSL